MLVVVLLFLMAFVAGAAAQKARSAESIRKNWLSLAIAIVATILYFGYTVGTDMAHRDNARSAAAAV